MCEDDGRRSRSDAPISTFWLGSSETATVKSLSMPQFARD